MLDTDTVSYLVKGRHPSVSQRFAHYGFPGTCISVCTLSELLYGLESRAPEDRLRQGILGFLERATVIPWDAPAAEIHARIRYRLDRAGQMIGVMDQMIAAQAMSLGLTLVTNNTRHFSRLEPELTVENWTDRPDIA
jgi:tRNA(fMet)-specific endonuclease VapC